MQLTLGFSPCPNDTFIFDALVNRKIDMEEFEFDVRLEDVQTLNKWALEGMLDITKISYGVLPLVLGSYELLDAGGALGKGVGPLLITGAAKKPGAGEQATVGLRTDDRSLPEDRSILESMVNAGTVAIPGENTTAHLLFSLAYPEARNKRFMIFSEIEQAVLSGIVDCGVIIHEGRFTYRQKGLEKVEDLGEFWEKKTGSPIPLGGILMRRGEDPGLPGKINSLIRKSLEYAFANYPLLPDYVRQHSQEMEERVMRQHIDLYVNNYSLSLGDEGRSAVETLLKTYETMHSRSHTPIGASGK